MNKTVISIIFIVIVLALGLKLISGRAGVPETKQSDLKNISIQIQDDQFDLVNGFAEKEYTEGSATKNKISIFGEPVMGDLDNDGDLDSAMLLLNEPGGSGSFFYAVLAINQDGKYKATKVMFLGDRIAPQTVEIDDGRAVYNFAERKSGEPLLTQPSVGKSVWVHYDIKNNQIGELVKDFEGEADTSKMTLGMKDWYWVNTELSDRELIIPKKVGVFYLKFSSDGKVQIHTDCNSKGGEYKTNGPEIIINILYTTRMFCENSQEIEFSRAVSGAQSFMFTNKGELIFVLKNDSGSMTFK
ncbi:MAG: META domain-containing protein [Minisyncoccia bacterium]